MEFRFGVLPLGCPRSFHHSLSRLKPELRTGLRSEPMLKTIVLLFTLLLAAESHWVLDLGGRIERDSAGAIAGVILRGTWVTDSDLEALRQMKEIGRLD